MMFKSIHFTAETTREEHIRRILQHPSPALPPKAKSPAAKVTGTYKAPNLFSPPIPETIMLNPWPNQQPPPNLSLPQILTTVILKPPMLTHRANPYHDP